MSKRCPCGRFLAACKCGRRLFAVCRIDHTPDPELVAVVEALTELAKRWRFEAPADPLVDLLDVAGDLGVDLPYLDHKPPDYPIT